MDFVISIGVRYLSKTGLTLFIVLIHFPGYLNATDPIDKMNSLSSMLKDLIISGASLLYARHVATDHALIG